MSGGGDDIDGLTGFFFYMFIVHPITAWILRPGRFERKKSILYAIGFLASLAAVKTGECDDENIVKAHCTTPILCLLFNSSLPSPHLSHVTRL
jgi:hypothetical protein